MQSLFRSRLGAATLALVLTAACQAGRSPVAAPAPEANPSLRTQVPFRYQVVSAEEIQNVETGYTALEALRRLRPEFLGRHAPPRPGDNEAGFAVVYLDGVRLGGLETLENIPVNTILEIRYLRPAAAADQLGRNHRGGVILVKTAP